ncbi:MAG: crossover junction endodeoxyribonuclease RuvC [Chlamydiia bacterium]
MTKKIILGFDPGTEKSGWALLVEEGSNVHLIDCGQIESKAKLPLQKRLYHLLVEAQKVIDRFSPNQVAIETQFTGINPKASMAIAMARGTLLVAAESKGIEVFEYAPTEAKRSITGKGNATKEEVQKMCGLIFKRPFNTPFDTTDAIALAYCHLNRTKMRRL